MCPEVTFDKKSASIYLSVGNGLWCGHVPASVEQLTLLFVLKAEGLKNTYNIR